MEAQTPTQAEWRALYQAADEIKGLAPWQWLYETDIFGVQNPETGEVGFVSVMGMKEEHFAVNVYLGAGALSRFWDLQVADDGYGYVDERFVVETLLNTPQIQASFEDRNDLHQRDRDVIKQLGLKYRGRKAWPQFQSFAPGYVPWFLTAAEARFLTHALTQTLEVARRAADDASFLETEDEDEYLIRTLDPRTDTWRDEMRQVSSAPAREYRFYMDNDALAHLAQLRPNMDALVVDFFWMPAPIGERGERPYYPYNLLLLDPDSQMILGTDLLVAKPSPDEMWGKVPMKLVQHLARLNIRPQTVRVVSESLAAFLQPVADELKMEIEWVPYLPELEGIKGMLMDFLQ